MRKIGIYGGTFDPPHLGHNEMLEEAIKQLNLDFVVVLPCGEPVHKTAVSNKLNRYEMCKLAFANTKGVFVSDYEVEQSKKNYTLLSLRHFAEIYSDSELYFIIGSDSLENFATWYKPREIADLATLVIAPRANHKFAKYKEFAEKNFGATVLVLNNEPLNVSSTELRYLVQFGLDTSSFLCKDVRDYISKRGLYSEHRQLCERVRSYMDSGRYLHTFYTTLEGMKLAKRLGADSEKAFYACLLHDVAKNMSQSEWQRYGFDNAENFPPPVIHAFLGAKVAEKDFGIDDCEILDEIKYHTTGKPERTRLEQIVYVADAIEITRGSNLDEVRKKVYADFDEGFLLCLKSSYNYAVRRVGADNVHYLTKESIKYYRKQAREKNEKQSID